MTLAALPSTEPFWLRLAAFGSAPALVTSESVLSYADLAGRVSALAARLGPTRRLVVLEASNDVDTVVGYLACLAGGHPVLLVEPSQIVAEPSQFGDEPSQIVAEPSQFGDEPSRFVAASPVAAAYDPDVVLSSGVVTELRPGTGHDLHPSLAVLLSTSGSTGSPKLVRLSADNVASNAAAIASSLQIRPTDVAATTLPLHYCYGLSVLTSHLAVGASVVLTDLSVVDPCFWSLVASRGVTTFPGVPHTFDLLDRIGFESFDVPSLRYLTCAGGRLAPAMVERFAALGQRSGFDLYVMYGATEATARMAYLPPDLALTRSSAVGIPIPGGSFSLSEGVGELVYRGDNVMLGYAESPADLGRGRDITELRTGDLARRTPDGLIEIVGRASRIAKVFGLRVDLGRVEQALLDAGVVALAVDAGDRVAVAVDRSAGPVPVERVREVVSALGVPVAAVAVVELDGIPRLASGKPDYTAIRAQAGELATNCDGSDHETRRLDPRNVTPRRRGVAGVYEAVLGRADVQGTDSFVSLGGDSLSYVAASLELEKVLGHLPAGWHLMTVGELTALRRAPSRRTRQLGGHCGGGRDNSAEGGGQDATTRRRWGRTVETNVLLRAAAIVMIVGSHANLFMLLGGAHLLLGLAGFNFARFQLTDRPRQERTKQLARSIARVVVPSVLWLALAAAISTKYTLLNVALLNGVLGTRAWSEAWHYWFVEALVWTLVVVTAVLAIPQVHRLERRAPFWFPMGLATAALLTRYDVVRLLEGDYIHRAHVLFWLFALGWAAVKAPTGKHRLLVTAMTIATVPGFFEGGQPAREATIIIGMLLLIWLPTVRVPAFVARAAGVLASASLYIYLVHWQIYPAYEFSLPWLATGLSLAAGIAFWLVVTRATPTVERWFGEIQDNRLWLSPRRYLTRDRNAEPLAGPAR